MSINQWMIIKRNVSVLIAVCLSIYPSPICLSLSLPLSTDLYMGGVGKELQHVLLYFLGVLHEPEEALPYCWRRKYFQSKLNSSSFLFHFLCKQSLPWEIVIKRLNVLIVNPAKVIFAWWEAPVPSSRCSGIKNNFQIKLHSAGYSFLLWIFQLNNWLKKKIKETLEIIYQASLQVLWAIIQKLLLKRWECIF